MSLCRRKVGRFTLANFVKQFGKNKKAILVFGKSLIFNVWCHRGAPWQQFHGRYSTNPAVSQWRAAPPRISLCDRSDLWTCCLFKHARVFITCTCWAFSAIQRERKTRQGVKCPRIHWAHSRRLNNSALSVKRGGKGARWCHDSHCQTSGTQLSLTCTCLRDLMGVCMWMFLCLRMRIRPTEANKVSLRTESGGTLVLLDCSAPTVWPHGPRVWILWWPCVLNGK